MSAENEGPKAVLGNMAGGTSKTASAAVDFAFQRATEMARAGGLATPALEHMLLALLQDESVLEILADQHVDPEAIRTSLLHYLEATNAERRVSDGSRFDRSLQDVMRRAALKNMVSNRREIEATDIVVAILVVGDSHAAGRRATALHIAGDQREQRPRDAIQGRREPRRPAGPVYRVDALRDGVCSQPSRRTIRSHRRPIEGRVDRGDRGPAKVDRGLWRSSGRDISRSSPADRWKKRLSLIDQAASVLATDAVDLLLLEEAPAPVAHRAIRDGRLLVDRDPRRRVEVVEDVLRRYLDEAWLRRELDDGLRARLAEGRFAR